jgi:glycosyltransferase involved in cell wall biosynthesis
VARIAIVIDPWDHPYNGTVVSTRRFVDALAAAGHQIRLLTIDGGPVAAGCERHAFQQLSIPGLNGLIDRMRAPLARPDARRIRDALTDCDLLHVQFPFFLGYAAIGEARRQGIPVICSFHVQPENILLNLGLRAGWLSRLLYRLFIGAFYNRADRIIAPSPFAAELLRRHGATRPVTVLSNGVPARFLAAGARRSDHSTTRSDGVFRILSVGRLASEKRQETLLEAVARSRAGHPIELTLAGTGPRESRLRALARRLGLDVRIGPVSDTELSALYGGADLFVHCGAVELEGMSVLEAMAAGNAVIVSDSPDSACSELVTEAQARFRVGDPDDLARKIDHWITHPLLRAREGAANHARAQSYSHAHSEARLTALYADCMSSTGAPRVASRSA